MRPAVSREIGPGLAARPTIEDHFPPSIEEIFGERFFASPQVGIDFGPGDRGAVGGDPGLLQGNRSLDDVPAPAKNLDDDVGVV